MEIKELKKAAERLEKAIKEQENVILYSDADLDGTASLIILEESIKSLGGKVAVCYFPDREEEGYGLVESALKKLQQYSPGLLILLDSGITSFKEIKLAKTMGFETVIVDHHEVLNGQLPEASVIVNPKQKGDDFSFRSLAACGLCFKLAQVLLQHLSPNLERSFLELVALGTLADMMPKENDNVSFIAKGTDSLLNSLRPGIKVFLDFFCPPLSKREFAQKIISVLQLTDSLNNLTESYLLLSTHDMTEARKLAQVLIEKSQARHQLIKEITEQIMQETIDESSVLIFEARQDITHLLIGSIASRLSNKFNKPTFIIASKGEISRGSVRLPKEFNSVTALSSCSSLLKTYGGHSQASGFTVENKNLEKLKICLTDYFERLQS